MMYNHTLVLYTRRGKALEQAKEEREPKASPQSSLIPSKIGDDDHSFIHRLKNPSLYSIRKRTFKVKGNVSIKDHMEWNY